MALWKIPKVNSVKNEFIYDLVKKILYISILFSIVVSALILKNFIQLNTLDPINDTKINKLIKSSQLQPKNNEIKKFIRELDLLIRKAYFTSLAFNEFGRFLLLGGLILFIVCIKVIDDLKKNFPNPGKFQQTRDQPRVILLLQKSVIGFAALLVISATIVPLVFKDKFALTLEKEYKTAKPIKVEFASKEEMMKNWPAFRGFHGLGIAQVTDSPVKWDAAKNKNIVWKFRIPLPGFNSPIIWNNYIFIAGASKDSREIYCIDKTTGRLLWKKATSSKNIQIPKVAEDTGLAAATMATNGKLVFAIFATGELLCTDFAGKVQWERKLPMPANHYGHSASLYTYRQLLLVQYDHSRASRVMAISPADGHTIWETKRQVEVSWTSPILVENGKKTELILTATPFIISYDPLTGSENWSLRDVIDGEIGSSASYTKGIVFFVNQFSKLVAVELKSQKILWQYDEDLPDASSPAALNEYLIVPTGFGRVTAMDAANGKIFWQHKFNTGFYASPIIADNKIYLLDKKGVMHILKLSKQLKIIASSPLGEAAVATPAFENGRIYIRGNEHLYAIAEKK